VAAARELVTQPLPVEREIGLIAAHGHAWAVLDSDRVGFDLGAALVHRVALDLRARSGEPQAAPSATPRTEWIADTGELAWRLPQKDRGVLEVKAPRAKAVIGHADGTTLDLGHGVRVTVGTTGMGWCTVSLALLEGGAFDRSPKRALLVATAHAENTGMVWKDAERTSVGTKWGGPPSLVEPVSATIEFSPAAGGAVLYPLDERGRRTGVAVPAAGDGRIAIGPPHKTLWYEIEFGGGK
jgi:hypothetical protein